MNILDITRNMLWKSSRSISTRANTLYSLLVTAYKTVFSVTIVRVRGSYFWQFVTLIQCCSVYKLVNSLKNISVNSGYAFELFWTALYKNNRWCMCHIVTENLVCQQTHNNIENAHQ